MSNIDEMMSEALVAEVARRLHATRSENERLTAEIARLRAEVAWITRERDEVRAQIDEAQRAVGRQVRHAEAAEAALAEVREAAEPAVVMCFSLPPVSEPLARAGHVASCPACVAGTRLRAALAATPADLATARDARVRAEALRAVRDAAGEGCSVHDPHSDSDGTCYRCNILDALDEAERIERGEGNG